MYTCLYIHRFIITHGYIYTDLYVQMFIYICRFIITHGYIYTDLYGHRIEAFVEVAEVTGTGKMKFSTEF